MRVHVTPQPQSQCNHKSCLDSHSIPRVFCAEMTKEFGHWLAGFTDGEGCFYTRIGKPRNPAWAPDIEPAFSIILRKDDGEILEEILRQTGWEATLRNYEAMTNRQGIASKPRVRMEVRRVKRCLAVVQTFDLFPLRAKKARDFQKWREIVLALAAKPRGNKWHGAADNSQIQALVAQLREGRAYDDTGT